MPFLKSTQTSNPLTLQQKNEQLAKERGESQPIGASIGCMFKNPSKEISAGRLIDKLGLKETKIGGMEVSAVHGNFMINSKNASAKDAFNLINFIKQKVFERKHIQLRNEVVLLGSFKESSS